MIVIDASVLAPALADDGATGEAVRTRLRGQVLAAPAVLDLEVTSVIRRGLRAGMLTDHRAALAMVDLAELVVERVPHTGLLRRIWELHANVTPYDAAYVALAELLEAPLRTADARLTRVTGPRCEFELVTA